MSKHYDLPTSRLICFGGAKACTQASADDNPIEDGVVLGYPE